MFRKVNKKRKPAGQPRITRVEAKDDDDDEEEASIHQRIQQTQKKHKLLAALPVASGDDKPSKRRFLVPNSMRSSVTEDEPQNLTVLAKKHKQAMEDFIQERLGNNESNSKEKVKTGATGSIDSEAALYQELAAATVPSKVLGAGTIEEDKGAMLVGGTGIAEVILPKDKRFDNSNPAKDGVRYSRNPLLSSAVAGGVDAIATDNILPTAGFRSMVPGGQNNEQTPGEAAVPKMPGEPHLDDSTAMATKPTVQAPQQEKVAVDESRPGFAALKDGGRKPEQNKPTLPKARGQQHQKDHEAFTKFIRKERSRR